jgi:Fe-S cluster assembly iron-binding protein IscA
MDYEFKKISSQRQMRQITHEQIVFGTHPWPKNQKTSTMKYISTKTKATIFSFLFMLCWSTVVFSQLPTVTVRFANPQYNCSNGQYCLDVEFQSDTDDIEVFGMNVRLFIDGEMMELVGFADFQGGYGPVSPDPPDVITSTPGIGFDLFGFGDPGTGIADFVNGAIQLLDDSQPAILINTVDWTKLFQVCFTIEDPNIDSSNFCPPVVWDLEQDPTNDGFLVGDDGVVITLTDPDPMVMSQPSNETVVQFNWQYVGIGAPPFGEPVELECISLDCVPTIVCAPDITIQCDASTDPLNTGESTAEEVCLSAITITFSDVTVEGGCDQAYTITRRWIKKQ